MESLLVIAALGGAFALLAPFLDRDSVLVRRIIIGFSLLMLIRYWIWRLTSTLPTFEWSLVPVLAHGFIVLEMVANYLGVGEFLLLKKTLNRTQEADAHLDWYGTEAPRIDVLVPTYNEPWEVLEKTFTGAANQNYPSYKVWILDDGKRPWLERKAEAYGFGYITRDGNEHYKAGNLNNGLKAIRGRGVALEFVAILDADFIARPEFLRRTMSLMRTDSVGIVQSPQFFYNPDPYQLAFGAKNWPDEQRAWFDTWLPALDAIGAASCCGTSCLIRARALDEIGDFPTDSVCEDTLSSICMRRKGWKTIYLHEPLTVGLAPEGLGEFLTQRARWLVGGIQNARFVGHAAGVKARLLYWLGLWKMTLFGVMRPAWMCITALYWFTGEWIIEADGGLEEAMFYFGPLWLDRYIQAWLFGGRRMPLVSDAHWTILSPLWVVENFRAIFSSGTRFSVTDKAVHYNSVVLRWQFLRFNGLMGLALLAGLVYTLVDPSAPAHNEGFWQANTFATLYFLVVIVAALAPALELPRRRTAQRYSTSEAVELVTDQGAVACTAENISIGGVLLKGDMKSLPDRVNLVVEGVGEINARLVRAISRGRFAFQFSSPDARPALIKKLFSTDDYIRSPQHWGISGAVGGFFRWLLF